MRARLPSSSAVRTRRDGWTIKRQIGFLAALAHNRSVTKAAASVGMSRESAYRLRARDSGSLFTVLWDEGLKLPAGAEGHDCVLSDGLLARLLGNHFRRENNGFVSASSRGPAASPPI